MDLISEDECRVIIENACQKKSVTVHGFYFEELKDHVGGLLSDTKKLVVEFSEDNDCKRNRMCFFAKTLPKNRFHEEYVLSTKGFDKEIFFFDKIKPNLDLWSDSDVTPKCYLAVPNKILVLELLSEFKVKDVSEYFSEDESKSSIRSLAVLHSASMMCESKNGIDLRSVWGDHFFDALYLRKDGHMGYKHMKMGITCVKAVIETHFPNLDERCRKKVYSLYDNLPDHILPSKKFRNVISHADLHTSNIMFSNPSTEGEIQAKIVDFQLFRFNPPALDLLLMIYTTANPQCEDTLDNLTNYYYDCVSSYMKKYNFDVSTELPLDEFKESLKSLRSLAIAIALLFQQFINLPPAVLDEIMNDPLKLRSFVLEKRVPIVITSFRNCQTYRNKLITTINHLMESCK